jgi:hypothetical protein
MGLNAQQMEKIAGRVWPAQGMATFALLDGAGIPTLLDKLYASAGLEFECLYSGELAPGVAQAAPYIARLEAGTEFAAWVLAGWGERRGIFAHVAFDMTTRHGRLTVVLLLVGTGAFGETCTQAAIVRLMALPCSPERRQELVRDALLAHGYDADFVRRQAWV